MPPIPPLLSALARFNPNAPVSIRGIIELAASAEERLWIKGIVETYLPNSASRVLRAEPGRKQLAEFFNAWGTEQFELDERYCHWLLYEEDYMDLESPWSALRAEGLPYQVYGFNIDHDEGLHMLTDMYDDVGLILMAYLTGLEQTEEPYVEEQQAGGIRTSWADWLTRNRGISKKTIQRIPPGGIPPDMVDELLRGTKMEPVGTFALWLHWQTGEPFADEGYCPNCGPGGHACPWDTEAIAAYAEASRDGREVYHRAMKGMDWLNSNTERKFNRLLDRILPRAEAMKNRPLVEVLAQRQETDDDDDHGTGDPDRAAGTDNSQRHAALSLGHL